MFSHPRSKSATYCCGAVADNSPSSCDSYYYRGHYCKSAMGFSGCCDYGYYYLKIFGSYDRYGDCWKGAKGCCHWAWAAPPGWCSGARRRRASAPAAPWRRPRFRTGVRRPAPSGVSS